jgi:diguanylate cyclase (GGDEF)-like protein
MTREINQFLLDKSSDKGILFVMDIDRFKSINDTYGHDVGDDVIRQFGKFLDEMFTNNEIVGRFGGDEFIAFIKNADNPDIARQIAADIVKGVAKSVVLADGSQQVSMSIGMAIYHGEEKNYSELFKKADIALYDAKADTRNRYRLYEG